MYVMNCHERSLGASNVNRRWLWKRLKPQFLARMEYSGGTTHNHRNIRSNAGRLNLVATNAGTGGNHRDALLQPIDTAQLGDVRLWADSFSRIWFERIPDHDHGCTSYEREIGLMRFVSGCIGTKSWQRRNPAA